MGNIFDFSGIKNSEQTIRKRWNEFRECLENNNVYNFRGLRG